MDLVLPKLDRGHATASGVGTGVSVAVGTCVNVAVGETDVSVAVCSTGVSVTIEGADVPVNVGTAVDVRVCVGARVGVATSKDFVAQAARETNTPK